MATTESEKQAIILFSLIGFVAVVIVLLAVFDLLSLFAILVVTLIVLIVMYSQMNMFFAQLQEYERAVVFKMGKFKEVFGPGWLFLIPFIESYTRVDLRVKTYDIKPQEVITKDNIKLMIDAIIYAQVSDPKAAILNVDKYEGALKSYTGATLRSVIGKLNLDNVISEIMQINQIIQEALQIVSTEWGIKVAKVEIQSLELPKSVQDAMHDKAAAEQFKMATTERAEAKRITIDAVQAAAGKLTDPTLQYMYLESLKKIAEGKSTKIIFPMELTKIAEQLSSKLGGFAKAEEILQDEYQEKVAQKKPKSTALQELAAQYGVILPGNATKVVKKTVIKKTTIGKRKKATTKKKPAAKKRNR